MIEGDMSWGQAERSKKRFLNEWKKGSSEEGKQREGGISMGNKQFGHT